MTKHRRFRVTIELVITQPLEVTDVNASISKSLACYPSGQASWTTIPLDAPAREDFKTALFGDTHLQVGKS